MRIVKRKKPILIDDGYYPENRDKTWFFFDERNSSRHGDRPSHLRFHCDHTVTQRIIDESSKHQNVEILEFNVSSTARNLPVFAKSLDLSPFGNCSDLTEVRIHNVYGPIDLSPLTNVNTLTFNYLHDTLFEGVEYLQDKIVEHFENHVIFPKSHHLKKVTFHGGLEHDRKSLAEYHKLDELIVEHPKELDWTWLSRSKSIKNLKMLYTFPKRIILPEIKSLKKLTIGKFPKDRVRGTKSLEQIDLTPLRVSKKLELLNIGKQKIKDVDLTPLASCKTLKELRIYGCDLRTIDVSPLLSEIPLETLDFRDNKIHSITLTVLPNLINLFLDKNHLQRLDLSCVSDYTSLRYLGLSYNQLIGIDLSPLTTLRQLQYLVLSNNRLDKIDLSPLSDMSNLHWIDIKPNKYLKEVDITPLLDSELTHFSYTGLKMTASKKMKDCIKSRVLRKLVRRIEWY